ncbi:MAG: CvpA family protein [Pseudomonadota bacterium]
MAALFNLYDYIFFAFILFFTFVGLARGFWVQFFATLVWGVGVVLYYENSLTFEQGFLSQYLSIPVAHWFTLAITLVGCFFINFLIRFILGSIFKLNAFTFFNKLGGLIFGACASAMIVVLVIYAVNSSSLGNESTDWKKSYIVTIITPKMTSFKEHNDNKITLTSSNTSVSQLGNTVEVA